MRPWQVSLPSVQQNAVCTEGVFKFGRPCWDGSLHSAELSLIHIIQLSLIHRSSLSLIRMRMRKVLAGPHRTHLGQFGIGRLAT